MGGGQHESEPGSPEETNHLLRRAQAGEESALNELLDRHGPRLRRWASGRLPRWARDLADTSDLVQDCLLRTFRKIETIDAERSDGLQAYLRQAVMNGIRDELRRANRRPAAMELDAEQPAAEPSPLELAIGREALERYDRALGKLRETDWEAVIARLELGFDYAELAAALGKPSANAARMVVQRALVRLAELMRLEH